MISLLYPRFADVETSHLATSEKAERPTVELAAEQRAAAESATPALVIAGPGTGKTSTLVGRIAWLIREQHVEPERILALTFSNKAAREMRDRVGQIIATVTENLSKRMRSNALKRSADYACRRSARFMPTVVNFCVAMVISSGCGQTFSSSVRPMAISCCAASSEQLPLTYYQPVTAPSHYYPDLLAAISRAKDELVGPAEYTALAEAMRSSAL